MKFFIRFTGHINERDRPEGFPKQVFDDNVIDFEPNQGATIDQQLIGWINARSSAYLQKQAMTISLHPSDVKVKGEVQTDRIIVPMHMITHISFSFVQVIEQEVVTEGLGGDLTPEKEDTPKGQLN